MLDALGEDAGVRDEDVVAHELDLAAQRLGHEPPAVLVLLGDAVLDRNDGVALHPVLVEPDHLLGSLAGLVGLVEHVLPVLEELARGRVEGERDLFTRLEARLLDGREDHLDRLVVGLQARCKSALIADGRVVALLG